MIVRLRLEDLSALSARVAQSAHDAGLESVRLPEIQLAVEETLVNIFRHGYGGRGGDIDLRCSYHTESRTFTVTITDWGPPFDIRNAPPPDRTTDLASRRPGGLGLLLALRMADEVIYSRTADKNEVRLVFRRRTE